MVAHEDYCDQMCLRWVLSFAVFRGWLRCPVVGNLLAQDDKARPS
jgi:hypothetical protein